MNGATSGEERPESRAARRFLTLRKRPRRPGDAYAQSGQTVSGGAGWAAVAIDDAATGRPLPARETPATSRRSAANTAALAGEAAPPRLRRPTLPFEVWFLGLAIAVVFAYLGIDRAIDRWHWLSDMHYFYDAAKIVTGEQRDILYDPEARVAAGFSERLGAEVFPYPASLAPLFIPFTWTDLESARLIFLGVEIGCLALVVGVAYAWSRDAWLALYVALVCISSFTLYEALRFNQLSPVLAALIGLGVLNLAGRRTLRGAFCLGLLAFKPSVALLPLAYIAWRHKPREVAIAAATAGTIAFIAPVLLVGVDGLQAYFDQLWRFRDEAFVLDGQFTAGASWMLNWHGFTGKLLSQAPNEAVVTALGVATVLLMLRVWLRGDVYTSLLAAFLATLLIMPHAVFYDWGILLGVAPFVAYVRRSTVLIGLVLLLHFTTSLDSYVVVTTAATTSALYTTPLVATALLLHLGSSRAVAAAAPQIQAAGAEAAAVTPA